MLAPRPSSTAASMVSAAASQWCAGYLHARHCARLDTIHAHPMTHGVMHLGTHDGMKVGLNKMCIASWLHPAGLMTHQPKLLYALVSSSVCYDRLSNYY